jgi:type IV secretion system protein VirB9
VTPNRRANLLFLKPMSIRPVTDMTVLTNLRRYTFQLGVRRKSSRRGPTYAVRFVYPEPAFAVAEPAAQRPVPAAPAEPVAPAERNRRYTYDGSPKTLPVRVFDDGQATYFVFKALEDLPAIFAVDPKGNEAVVNSHQHGGYVVVDQLARGFVLRRGSEVTHILNEGFGADEPSQLKPYKKGAWWVR